jgi:hypothetical protein
VRRDREFVIGVALSCSGECDEMRKSILHRGRFLLHFAPACVREHPESSRKLQVPLDQNL